MIIVRRVGVFSLAKIMGVLYALLGLILGGLFSCISLIGTLAAMPQLSEGSGDQAFGLLFGVGAIIFLPLIYGLMGFIGGLIIAALYNLVAGRIGGIELETA
jgi:hypothetical protein